MHQPPSLFGTPREWAQDLGLATVIGAFLGVIGPFGSFYGGPIEVRVPYWIANFWVGFIVTALAVRLAIRGAARLDLPIWFTLMVGVVVASLPLGLIVGLISAWMWPPNHGRITPLGLLYGQTLALALPVSFAYYWLGARDGSNPPLWGGGAAALAQGCAPGAGSDESAGSGEGRGSDEDVGSNGGVGGAGASFLDRLPPRLGRDLLCLQMEDHYVRAHTARGSDLVLTPLKEAIAELGDTPGMQVHRSWWVARAAVAEPVTVGRNLFLRLTNGLEAPVSRQSVAKLKAAGWITQG